jgi:hypothetical protein
MSEQAIWAIGVTLGKRDDETELEAAERVSAMLDDIARLCSAAADESPFDAASRLLDDYRHVVRQRDRMVAEMGTIAYRTKALAAHIEEIDGRMRASRIGRGLLTGARVLASVVDAFRRR